MSLLITKKVEIFGFAVLWKTLDAKGLKERMLKFRSRDAMDVFIFFSLVFGFFFSSFGRGNVGHFDCP